MTWLPVLALTHLALAYIPMYPSDEGIFPGPVIKSGCPAIGVMCELEFSMQPSSCGETYAKIDVGSVSRVYPTTSLMFLDIVQEVLILLPNNTQFKPVIETPPQIIQTIQPPPLQSVAYPGPAVPIVPVAPMECFSGDLIVETLEGPKRMIELTTGDKVLSVEDNAVLFSPIIMFLHREEEVLAEINVITTVNNDTVKITNEHLIHVTDCLPNSELRTVKAKEVTTEHCLMTIHAPAQKLRMERIASVTKTFERGIYSPLTSSGDIIVNDVVCSCHSNIAVRTLQQSFFTLYRSLSFLLPEEGAIPLGVAYLIRVIDLFIPVKMILG